MIKLSIITPYYDRKDEIVKLAKVLKPQLSDAVEWIIVDDGCHEELLDTLPAVVIHLPENSGGASIPRNVGLNNAKGEYIAFIDSDDLVSESYVKLILHKIRTEPFDYCYIGWRCEHFELIIHDEPPEWNCCVWNCIYNRKIIGNARFRPDLKMAEDYYFNLEVRTGKRVNIDKVLYFYNSESPGSLTKQGETYNNKFI